MWEETMCVLNYRKNIATVLAPNGHLFPKTFEARYPLSPLNDLYLTWQMVH